MAGKKKRRGKYEPQGWQVRVKRSSAGLGLFAGQDIPKGACIIEYKGRVISEKEAYTSRSKYLFEVTKKMTIDGTARTNTARYANHSCLPNAEIEIYKRRVYLMARKAIKEGEEIVYDYGEEYFDDHIRPKGCKCTRCAVRGMRPQKKKKE